MKRKKCSRCLEIKPVKRFKRDTTYRDGYHPICDKCLREAEERGDDYYIQTDIEILQLAE